MAASHLFHTTIAGSLPKPGWLAETDKLWPQWRQEGADLVTAKQDATLLWLKSQEESGIDIVTDGEQSRQHFVHGFLEAVEGIDFANKVKMGTGATLRLLLQSFDTFAEAPSVLEQAAAPPELGAADALGAAAMHQVGGGAGGEAVASLGAGGLAAWFQGEPHPSKGLQ